MLTKANQFFRWLLNFYIKSSIHVAFAVFAFVRLTQLEFGIQHDEHLAWFCFWGTLLAYNFVKYESVIWSQKERFSVELTLILILSGFAILPIGWLFFSLIPTVQIVVLVLGFLTVLYALPFFPNKTNARNWAGIKIYIVAFCWMGTTVILPVIDANYPLSWAVLVDSALRFILVFVLTLIFEIKDSNLDDPYLETVPQKIGISKTKQLGLFLLISSFLIHFYLHGNQNLIWLIDVCIVLWISERLLRVKPESPLNFTSFWTESIPIVWWLGVLIFIN